MTEVLPVPAAQAKTSRKKPVAKARKPGPSVSDLILEAVATSSDRKGISYSALKKILVSKGYSLDTNNSRVKTALKALLAKGALQQTKGNGASGSFRIPPKAKKPAKKVTTPAKKTTPKKPAAKKEKAVAVSRSATKKTVKKLTVKKKVTPSPKKTKKTVQKKAKSTPAKKAKAVKRKTPAKKAAKAKAAPKKKK